MPKELTPGQKAALTRKRRAAAQKATATKKRMDAVTKARAAEAASKEALRADCDENGFQLAFFEGKTGAPRPGIIYAVVFRIARGQADVLDPRLVQLQGGSAGVSGAEIARLLCWRAQSSDQVSDFTFQFLGMRPKSPDVSTSPAL